MEKAPKSLRLHIGLFGRTNVGKSSFLNMISSQAVAITSALPGTTTDVVSKVMELLPLGPVVFLDTAGLDDLSELAESRIEKAKKALDASDIILLIVEPGVWGVHEEKIIQEAKEKKVPCIIIVNKIDAICLKESFIDRLKKINSKVLCCSSVVPEKSSNFLDILKKELIEVCPSDFLNPPFLIGDLLPPGGIACLIVPIDLQAPKGRLILPQVQTIRDVLDNDASALVVKEREYSYLVNVLKIPFNISVCDSQVVLKMVADTPKTLKCTTFSILFSRYKGDLAEAVKGVVAVDNLKPGDRVLIAEACSHHPIEDDIGRIKIPRWINQYTGINIKFDFCAGSDYPLNLKDYKLIIHCGGCMITRRQMMLRIQQAKEAKVPITNYGVCIAFLQGVLGRVLLPFPAVFNIIEEYKVLKKDGKNEKRL